MSYQKIIQQCNFPSQKQSCKLKDYDTLEYINQLIMEKQKNNTILDCNRSLSKQIDCSQIINDQKIDSDYKFQNLIDNQRTKIKSESKNQFIKQSLEIPQMNQDSDESSKINGKFSFRGNDIDQNKDHIKKKKNFILKINKNKFQNVVNQIHEKMQKTKEKIKNQDSDLTITNQESKIKNLNQYAIFLKEEQSNLQTQLKQSQKVYKKNLLKIIDLQRLKLEQQSNTLNQTLCKLNLTQNALANEKIKSENYKIALRKTLKMQMNENLYQNIISTVLSSQTKEEQSKEKISQCKIRKSLDLGEISLKSSIMKSSLSQEDKKSNNSFDVQKKSFNNNSLENNQASNNTLSISEIVSQFKIASRDLFKKKNEKDEQQLRDISPIQSTQSKSTSRFNSIY